MFNNLSEKETSLRKLMNSRGYIFLVCILV